MVNIYLHTKRIDSNWCNTSVLKDCASLFHFAEHKNHTGTFTPHSTRHLLIPLNVSRTWSLQNGAYYFKHFSIDLPLYRKGYHSKLHCKFLLKITWIGIRIRFRPWKHLMGLVMRAICVHINTESWCIASRFKTLDAVTLQQTSKPEHWQCVHVIKDSL